MIAALDAAIKTSPALLRKWKDGSTPRRACAAVSRLIPDKVIRIILPRFIGEFARPAPKNFRFQKHFRPSYRQRGAPFPMEA
jgi:hypothetical protein